MPRTYTKYLMILSALVMFGLGALLTFAPRQAIHAAGGAELPLLVVVAQACGALFLGFAILNWMSRESVIGGIYGRPLSLGNFLHFFAAAIALAKSFSTLPRSPVTLGLLLIYCFLAVGFGSVLFRHPKAA